MSIIMALVLGISLLAGCGGSSTDSTDSASETAEETSTDEEDGGTAWR